jgi:hypothetical protein
MDADQKPILLFGSEFDERAAFEAEARGYIGNVVVQLPSGALVELCFYDPVRLVQDLETLEQSGEACIGDPGLVVVPRVTVGFMENAANQLYKKGYLNRLVPI